MAKRASARALEDLGVLSEVERLPESACFLLAVDDRCGIKSFVVHFGKKRRKLIKEERELP